MTSAEFSDNSTVAAEGEGREVASVLGIIGGIVCSSELF